MSSWVSRLRMRHMLGAVTIGVLLSYQNCSQAPDSTDNSESSYVDGLAFAYKAQVDTIGYMSCSEIKVPVESRAYFSYRVGAYNNATGGITLSKEFTDATKYYSVTERAQALG